ncbi:hypothetical protein PVAND_000857 [Polypedilum vanderplanki]|uniref:Endonuclease/exonuclease/phosphatase domain-containing protein n=1 Tax=Polypedilum vanderplanki TaxID=319348 RepID=A0A9J6BLL2_POLVA|nr:hypothetical protein PVAND_000857 [Polypedilum vanderplanki]
MLMPLKLKSHPIRKLFAAIHTDNQQLHKENESILELTNRLEQLNLADQISIHNLPKNIEIKVLIQKLNQWSNGLFEDKYIRRVNIINSKEYSNSTAFISFWTEQAKHSFLNFLKTKQKDTEGRYVPILTEHLFVLEQLNHQDVGKSIDFRSPMTKLNAPDFQHASPWIKQQGLKPNYNKTKYLLFHNRLVSEFFTNQSLNIHFGTTIIERVQCLKLLGLFVDEQLSFTQHIDHICKKWLQIGKSINNNPSSSLDLLKETLLEVKDYIDESENILILGDFNHELKLGSSLELFMLQSFGTRLFSPRELTTNARTVIDGVFGRIEDYNVEVFIYESYASHHKPLVIRVHEL